MVCLLFFVRPASFISFYLLHSVIQSGLVVCLLSFPSSLCCCCFQSDTVLLRVVIGLPHDFVCPVSDAFFPCVTFAADLANAD